MSSLLCQELLRPDAQRLDKTSTLAINSYKFFLIKTHLPGYLEQSEALKTKGVSEIICISVNDPFVMSAWGKQNDAGGKVRMLADPVAAFTKQIDLAVDLPPLGGLRSKRYSMVVDNGIIKQLNVEPDNTGLSCSLANKLNI